MKLRDMNAAIDQELAALPERGITSRSKVRRSSALPGTFTTLAAMEKKLAAIFSQ